MLNISNIYIYMYINVNLFLSTCSAKLSFISSMHSFLEPKFGNTPSIDSWMFLRLEASTCVSPCSSISFLWFCPCSSIVLAWISNVSPSSEYVDLGYSILPPWSEGKNFHLWPILFYFFYLMIILIFLLHLY